MNEGWPDMNMTVETTSRAAALESKEYRCRAMRNIHVKH
jgi:hypothetical protein